MVRNSNAASTLIPILRTFKFSNSGPAWDRVSVATGFASSIASHESSADSLACHPVLADAPAVGISKFPTSMIFRFSALLALSLLGFAPLGAADEPPSPPPLKIVFWNIQWFPGGDQVANETQVAAQVALVQPALAALNPDILGMEEIRDAAAADLALAEIPDLKVQVCSDFLGPDGEDTTQQVVIASRQPAMGAWWEAWKQGAAITPKRGFAFAAFQPAPSHVLLVYTVHLKSNRGKLDENIAMREESATQLLSHVAAMEKAYGALGVVSVVIGGDFNTSVDDAKFGLEETLTRLTAAGFESCWKNRPLTERVTLPSEPSNNPQYPPFPDACFDFAFVKNAKFRSARVEIPAGKPSDHRPVVVELELPTTPH